MDKTYSDLLLISIAKCLVVTRYAFALQLQRNILATCPRVTRFKIDWGDTDESENVAPPMNTENESNQMELNQPKQQPFGTKEDSTGLTFGVGMSSTGTFNGNGFVPHTDSNQMITD